MIIMGFNIDNIEKTKMNVWQNSEFKVDIVASHAYPVGQSNNRRTSVFTYNVNGSYGQNNNTKYDGFLFNNNIFIVFERKENDSIKSNNFNNKFENQVRLQTIELAWFSTILNTAQLWLENENEAFFKFDGSGKLVSVTKTVEKMICNNGLHILLSPEMIIDSTNDQLSYQGIGFYYDSKLIGRMSPMEFIYFQQVINSLTYTLHIMPLLMNMEAQLYGIGRNIQDIYNYIFSKKK